MKQAVRTAITAAVVGLTAVGCSATAAATPGDGVSGTVLGQSEVGGVDYILREIIIAPGGSTGWHYQDGTAYVVVVGGTLRLYGANCALAGIRRAGDVFVEQPGDRNVHLGRTPGPGPVVLDVLYVQKAGTPPARDAPASGCGGATAPE
jgi:quercetin dioxygenase-like cupin family protein